MNDNQHTSNNDLEMNVNVIDIMQYLWQKKHLIIMFTIITTTIASIYLFYIRKPIYLASAVIQTISPKKSAQLVLQEMKLNHILTPALKQTANIEFKIKPLFNTPYQGDDLIKITNFYAPLEIRKSKLKLEITPKNTFQLIDSKNQILLSGKLHTLISNQIFGISIKVEGSQLETGQSFEINPQTFELSTQGKDKITEEFVDKKLSTDEVVKGENLIRISYQHTNPIIAIQFLEKIIQSYIDAEKKRKDMDTQETLAFLNKEMEEVQNKMTEISNLLKHEGPSKNINQENFYTAYLTTIKQLQIESQLFGDTLQKLELAKMEVLNNKLFLTKVIDKATLRDEPINKKPLPMIITTILLTILISCIVYAIRYIWQNNIKQKNKQ